MKELLLKKQTLDYKGFVKRSALEADFSKLIEGDCIGVDAETKQVVFVYKQLDFDDAQIMAALDRVEYEVNIRTNGLKTTSRIFGYKPRNTIRGDYCTVTGFAAEQPIEHAIVCKYGLQIAELYEKFTPEVYKQHQALMKEKVLDEYKIRNTPFTSGVINKNNPLKYHFDSGNFKNVYSCMAVFKRDISGGYLSLPEYGVGLELAHNTVFMFDGQSVLHGVTPITRLSDSAMRYSIVYYSLQRIWKCLPLSEELARIRTVKTEREVRRAKGEVHKSLGVKP